MAFTITYYRPTDATSIIPGIFDAEWITPAGWTRCDATAAFEARHPGCTVIRCDDIGNPCENFAHPSLA